MTEQTAPPGQASQSTPESRTAALTMWEGSVPCFFQLFDPSCPANATVLAHFAHEEPAPNCGSPDPFPVCPAHTELIQKISIPFWRTWFAMDALPCNRCSTPVRLETIEPIR